MLLLKHLCVYDDVNGEDLLRVITCSEERGPDEAMAQLKREARGWIEGQGITDRGRTTLNQLGVILHVQDFLSPDPFDIRLEASGEHGGTWREFHHRFETGEILQEVFPDPS